MKSTEKRTVRNFSRKEIAELAISYATTEVKIARTSFCKDYDISESTYYSMLHKAVVECIVSDKIVEQIRKKSASNASSHAGRRGMEQTAENYNYLIARRSRFEFPKTTRQKIAMDYAMSELSKKEYCEMSYMTTQLFDRTITSAIVDILVSDKYVELLEEKACRNNGDEKAKPLFKKLRNFRLENRKKKKSAK